MNLGKSIQMHDHMGDSFYSKYSKNALTDIFSWPSPEYSEIRETTYLDFEFTSFIKFTHILHFHFYYVWIFIL